MKTLLITILLLILLPCCAALPTPRPWTKAETIVLGASCLAAVADAYTTTRALDNGCEEMNPLIGKHPSDGAVIVFMGITQAATIIVAHYWPDFRLWILGFKTAVNGAAAARNSTQY